MRAGPLRHRLTFQDKTVSRDAYGEEDVTWSDSFTVWGSIDPLRGREYMEARQQQADITHRIRIRYRSGVKPSMRIVFDLDSRDARTFNIVTPPIEAAIRQNYIELLCQEEIED